MELNDAQMIWILQNMSPTVLKKKIITITSSNRLKICQVVKFLIIFLKVTVSALKMKQVFGWRLLRRFPTEPLMLTSIWTVIWILLPTM